MSNLMPSYRILLRLAIALACVACPANAHEFWIEPETPTRTEVGEVVPIVVAVGQDFVGERQIMIPDRVARFEAIGPHGIRPAARGFAEDPAGEVRVDAEGLYTVVYQNRPAELVLDPKTFEIYARMDGVEHALKARAAAGRSNEDAVERYTRFPKTFVLAGPPAAGAGATEPVGLRFELVPETNPFLVRAGEQLPVRVLFEGAPLDGILVQAFHKGRAEKLARVRSDADGHASIALPHPGRWMISAVHLVPSRTPGIHWESFWATFTLDVPAP